MPGDEGENGQVAGPVEDGFWLLQRHAWGALFAWLRTRYTRRARIGAVGGTAAVATAIAVFAPMWSAWLYAGDIKITSVKEGERVERCIETLSGTGELGDGHHLWIALETSRADRPRNIVFSAEARLAHGEWHADNINVGGEKREGASYMLVTVDVDSNTHQLLSSAVIDMYPRDSETLKPGEDLWRLSTDTYPTGAVPIDEVRVTRGASDTRSCYEIEEQGRR
ncbi:hypothetical protein QF035_011212 [Streptomyces umbrinus]|uniref:DUF4179 domain-containing protein n=1 Tax=Streptomyces umbrinus TaxID=67370 RepID=A0ABU0TCJ7_9ACTN|nr:hypothetical protein [Streptomyces umbrinus]MDQ1033543.1 hypothetical protein [Streptomyces umbrinus]